MVNASVRHVTLHMDNNSSSTSGWIQNQPMKTNEENLKPCEKNARCNKVEEHKLQKSEEA